jgi:hypothetical protein
MGGAELLMLAPGPKALPVGQALLRRGLTYQPRVLNAKDAFHQFPYTLDDHILRNGGYAQRIADRAYWFTMEGTVNGVRGIYTIGVNTSREVFHRAFLPFRF